MRAFNLYLEKHITVLTVPVMMEIGPEGIMDMFSGILEQAEEEYLRIRLRDGTSATYEMSKIVGIVENKMAES